MEKDKVRIDKWLWAVRVCKTRKISGELCARGQVKIAGAAVKSSRMLQAGDVVSVRKEGLERQYEVLRCIEKRVGAKLVPDNMRELTPQDEIDKHKAIKAANSKVLRRPKGAGRPTKKDRRQIDRLRG